MGLQVLKVSAITSDPLQKQTLSLPDGSTLLLTIYFVSQQRGWFIKELSYNGFVIQGLRLCIGINLLEQFKNKIPFGLCCLTKSNREPFNIQDFSSGNSALYILTADEVLKYSRFLSGQ